jgi:hypothetical protein
MRKLILAGAAAITLCGTATTLAAQAEPPVIQVQANPPGLDVPTMTSPDPVTAQSSVRPAMPADSSYNAGPYKGALTAPPAQAMNKVYPLCTSRMQDSCVNTGEAGMALPKPRSVRRLRRN